MSPKIRSFIGSASRLLAAAGCVSVVATASAGDIVIPTVVVGSPGNDPDPVMMQDGTTGYGDVEYLYEIGVNEITNTQYVVFLNKVADFDTNGLYNIEMEKTYNGGIRRIGPPGSHFYQVLAGFEDKPVIFVSFYDIARFANWLHNGQPTGPQNPNTTEDGAYTMLGPTEVAPGDIDGNGRNSGWLWALPDEDEWHKAAYLQLDGSWTVYATQSDDPPTAVTPPGDPNSANFDFVAPFFTEVGAYVTTPGPWGAFDQNGNVQEYNEGEIPQRRVRGGDWDSGSNVMRADFRGGVTDGTHESNEVGFRLVKAVLPCPADIDGSGDVGFGDLVDMLSNWGPCGVPCPQDIDDDGIVGFGDLLALLAAWGPCP